MRRIDVRHLLRNLRRAPASAIAAVLTLSLTNRSPHSKRSIRPTWRWPDWARPSACAPATWPRGVADRSS